MGKGMQVGACALAAALAAGCARSAPTAPGAPTSAILTGTWTGSVAESYGGQGRLKLDLEQVQFGLMGTFQLDFDDVARSRGGTVSGNVATASLPGRMQLSSPQGIACPAGQSAASFLQVTWGQAAGRLTGAYSGFSCVGTITGTFDVGRE